MIPSVADIRASGDGFAEFSDYEILQAAYPAYKKYYPDFGQFAKAAGVNPGTLAGNRVGAGVDNYQANLYGLGEAVLAGTAAEPWLAQQRVSNETQARGQQQFARDQGAIDSFREVGGVGDFFNYAGGLAAQTLPYAGEAIVGGLVGGATLPSTAARMGLGLSRGAAATAGGVVASYPSAVGDILQNQRDEAGVTDLGSAAIGGIPYAALNAVGVEGMLSRGLRGLGTEASESMLRRMGTGAVKVAGSEGLSETGQELINQGFGRMAVNPNQTLFNPEANERYLESFVGGATLGAFGGAIGGLKRKPVEEQPDLLSRTQEPPVAEVPQLGFSGYDTGVGQIISFPDGSSMLRSEWEQLVREGRTPDLEAKYPGFLQGYDQTAGPMFEPGSRTMDGQLVPSSADRREQGAIELAALPGFASGLRGDKATTLAQMDAQMRGDNPVPMVPGQQDLFFPNGEPTYGADGGIPDLVTRPAPLQQRIDQNLGIGQPGFAGKGYPAQFQAASSEPTSMWAQNPATGAERQLDVGQLYDAQVPGPQEQGIRQAADKAAAVREAAHADLVGDKNPDGSYVVKLKPRAVTAHSQMVELRDAGVMSQAAFEENAGKLREAVQADDNGTINAVAKQVQENYVQFKSKSSVQPATNAGGTVAAQSAAPASGARRVRAEKPAGTTVAPVANTAQPGAVAGIDPNKTVTVGRAGREKSVTPQQAIEMLSNAKVDEKRIILAATGYDLDVNPTTMAPMVVNRPEGPVPQADIAKTLGVSRQAVNNTLAKFGLSDEKVNAIQGDNPTTYTEADLGIGGDGGLEAAGMRVENTASKATGSGLVEGETETAAQRKNRQDADALLKAAGPSTAVATSDETRPTNLPTGAVVTDLREGNAGQVESNIRRIITSDEFVAAAADWPGQQYTIDQLPDTLKADWYEAYRETLNKYDQDWNSDVEAELTAAAEKIERDADILTGGQQAPKLEQTTRLEVQGITGNESVDGRTQAPATTVVTKKKKRIVRPDSDTPFSNPRFSKSVKPKSDAVRAQEARVDKYKQLLACLTA